MPNAYGFELSPGDDLGHDTAPTCCGNDMTAKDTDESYRAYTCGCGTVLIVGETGLIFDITD